MNVRRLIAVVIALVVCGVVALAWLNASSWQAHANNCLSDAKGLSTGLQMYCSDNNDRLPPADHWNFATYPYVKNIQMYGCPSDDPLSSRIQSWRTAGDDVKTQQIAAHRPPLTPTERKVADQLEFSVFFPCLLGPSYAMNSRLGLTPMSLARGVPLLFDGTALAGDASAAAFRHHGGLCVGFVDGHGKWLSKEQLLSTPFAPPTGGK
jgi:hypothetical protein